MPERWLRSTDFQRNLGETMDDVRRSHEAVVVTSHGRPIMVLMPFEEYGEYRRWQIEHDQIREVLRATEAVP